MHESGCSDQVMFCGEQPHPGGKGGMGDCVWVLWFVSKWLGAVDLVMVAAVSRLTDGG